MNSPIDPNSNTPIEEASPVGRKQTLNSLQWGKRNSAGVVIASSMTFENVGFQAGRKTILQDVSLSVEPGKVLCLLGPSGSGKTSLLRIAAGLTEPTSGRVRIDDRIVSDNVSFVPPEKRGVGLVFQDFALFPHLTILQNVEFGLTALSKDQAREQALHVLSRVGMEDRAAQYPHVLSGGEQQRVALARALAPRPGILLMDEPFSGLDSRLRDTVREQSLDLLRETRSTAIIVTHDAEEALRVGDHIALIRDGKLVQQGSGHELYYNPVNLFAARFFSEINVIPGEVNGDEIKTVFGSIAAKSDGTANRTITSIAIRLTDIEVMPYDKSNLEYVVGLITNRRFIGTSELLEVNVEHLDHPVQVRIKAGLLGEDSGFVHLKVHPNTMMEFPNE